MADIYQTTTPALGDELYDLVGKTLQQFNADNGTGGPSPAGYEYPTCDPQQGDSLADRYGKLAQAQTLAAP